MCLLVQPVISWYLLDIIYIDIYLYVYIDLYVYVDIYVMICLHSFSAEVYKVDIKVSSSVVIQNFAVVLDNC